MSSGVRGSHPLLQRVRIVKRQTGGREKGDLRVYGVCFRFVAIKPDDGEFLVLLSPTETLWLWFESYRLHLSWINLYDPYPRGDELPSQRIGEAPHRRFRRAVDAPSRIRFPAGYTANVDDVPLPAIRSSLFEDW